jgi:hypothetical protein
VPRKDGVTIWDTGESAEECAGERKLRQWYETAYIICFVDSYRITRALSGLMKLD